MSSAEQFIDEEIQEIVDFNRKTVKRRKEGFGVKMDKLKFVFDSANSIDATVEPDKKKRILKKASNIISGITWSQPFNNGNKTTALACGKMLLNRNGFELSLNRSLEKEVYALLGKISFKFEGDPSIYTEMEEFVFKNVVNL